MRTCRRDVSGAGVGWRLAGFHRSRCIALLIGLLVLAGCSSAAGQSTVVPTPTSTPERDEVVVVARARVVVMAPDEDARSLIHDVVVAPASIRVRAGDSVQLYARAYDRLGREVPGTEFVWAAEDPAAGELSGTGDGHFTGGSVPGTYESAIRATASMQLSDGRTASVSQEADVTVLPAGRTPGLAQVEVLPERVRAVPGQIVRMLAFAYDETGHLAPTAQISWEVTDAALGSVSHLGYLKMDAEPGIYREALRATAHAGDDSVSRLIDVEILPSFAPTAPRLSAHVIPGRVHLLPGGEHAFRVVAIDELGRTVSGTRVSWSVANPEAGTVDGEGQFLAGDEPGDYLDVVSVDVIWDSDGEQLRASDHATVVVGAPIERTLLETCSVDPVEAIIEVGSEVLFVARGLDAEGRPVTDLSTAWSVADERIGEIDSGGRLTARGEPGYYRDAVRLVLTQESDGRIIERTATAHVIIAGTLRSASIDPISPAVAAGGFVHFEARGFDQNGIEIPGLRYRWTVADPTAGSIDPLGVFRAGDTPGVYGDAVVVEIVQVER